MVQYTDKGAPYPSADRSDPNNPPLHIKQLADWVNARPGVAVMSTTQRNALSGTDLWEGRVIANITTGLLERREGTAWTAVAGRLAPMTQGQIDAAGATTGREGTLYYNAVLKRLELHTGTGTAPVPTADQGLYFGTGSDGDVTIVGTSTSLTRDMHYANLTVPDGTQITTNGFRIFVRGTANIAGILQGPNGGDVVFNQNGTRPGGAGGATGSLGPGSRGANSSTAGSSPTRVGFARLGGLGGRAGGNGAGTLVGSHPAQADSQTGGWETVRRSVLFFLLGLTPKAVDADTAPVSAADASLPYFSGGDGGGAAYGNGNEGGPGGGGGGIVLIAARVLIWAATAKVRANGGSSTTGFGGGSAGGGGGALVEIYAIKTGAVTNQMTGGAGSNGASASFGNGESGQPGVIHSFPVNA